MDQEEVARRILAEGACQDCGAPLDTIEEARRHAASDGFACEERTAKEPRGAEQDRAATAAQDALDARRRLDPVEAVEAYIAQTVTGGTPVRFVYRDLAGPWSCSSLPAA